MNFEKFWERWPDKTNKTGAFKAWRSLRPVERAKAVAYCEAWCADWRKNHKNASHIHAATYLSQKRFLDMDEVKNNKSVVEVSEYLKKSLSSKVPSVREHAKRMAEKHGISLKEAG